MVTINQKLSLFQNMLQRSLDDEFKQEMTELRQEYSQKLQTNKEAADREAAEIIARTKKKAEAERVGQISRIRLEFKKEYMNLKEKLFSRFMERVINEVEKFTVSDRYPGYMMSLVQKLMSSGELPENTVIYMTKRDLERYAEDVKRKLVEQKQTDIKLREAPDSIIGGFIAENPADMVRIDLSMSALLQDNEDYIMQMLFQAIEAGDANDNLEQ